MDGIQLNFLPQLSESLFKIEKTKSVSTIFSDNNFKHALFLHFHWFYE